MLMEGMPANFKKTISAATSDYGKYKRNLAPLRVGATGPNYIREKLQYEDSGEVLSVYSVGIPDDDFARPMYRIVKNGATLTAPPLTQDDSVASSYWGSVKEFRYEILPLNVNKLGCYPVSLTLDTTLPTGTDLQWKATNCNRHSFTAPLLSVHFSTAPDAAGTKIVENAFAFATNLSRVDIPKGYEMDGTYTFYMGYPGKLNNASQGMQGKVVKSLPDLPMLSTVKFNYISGYTQPNGYPDDEDIVHITENSLGVRSMHYTFGGCTALKEINLQNTDPTHLSGTFDGCSSLLSLMLPKSVVLINNSALSGCTQLNNIIFDTALTAVGAQALNTVAPSLTAKNTNATYGLGSPTDARSSPN